MEGGKINSGTRAILSASFAETMGKKSWISSNNLGDDNVGGIVQSIVCWERGRKKRRVVIANPFIPCHSWGYNHSSQYRLKEPPSGLIMSGSNRGTHAW